MPGTSTHKLKNRYQFLLFLKKKAKNTRIVEKIRLLGPAQQLRSTGQQS